MNLLTHLGIFTEKITDQSVILTMEVTENHHQPYGIMHGGVNGVLIESACSIGANHTLLSSETYAVGVDMTVTHLKSVAKGKITTIAIPDRIGRNIHVWQATIYNEKQEKIAIGRCTLTIRPK